MTENGHLSFETVARHAVVGRFVGIIPPHRLVAVLLSEHEEDLSRLGGFLSTASAARASSRLLETMSRVPLAMPNYAADRR